MGSPTWVVPSRDGVRDRTENRDRNGVRDRTHTGDRTPKLGTARCHPHTCPPHLAHGCRSTSAPGTSHPSTWPAPAPCGAVCEERQGMRTPSSHPTNLTSPHPSAPTLTTLPARRAPAACCRSSRLSCCSLATRSSIWQMCSRYRSPCPGTAASTWGVRKSSRDAWGPRHPLVFPPSVAPRHAPRLLRAPRC